MGNENPNTTSNAINIKYLLRIIILLLGLAILSLGSYIMVIAGLGTNPWTVFYIGATKHIHFSVGQVSQLTGILIMVISLCLGIKPGVGTILNMYFYGLFYDIWAQASLFPQPSSIVQSSLYFFLGINVFAIGCSTYICVNLGAGPRDALMLALNKKYGFSISMARGAMETTILAIGYLMGGPVGIGTIAHALYIGIAIQACFNIIAWIQRITTTDRVTSSFNSD